MLETIMDRRFENVRAVAFDADDTLWENEPLFREAESRWAEVLKDYGTEEELSARLYEMEEANMPTLGYGAKAFTISLISTAVSLAGRSLDGDMTARILDAGLSILRNPCNPMPGVRETLGAIRSSGLYRMILLTKGDLLDQKMKVGRSGLSDFFDLVEIVSDKNADEYARICVREGIRIEEFLMVGNSFKSDIKPVLDLGGNGIFIPFRITWEHEKTEEFDHPRLVRAGSFTELADILLP